MSADTHVAHSTAQPCPTSSFPAPLLSFLPIHRSSGPVSAFAVGQERWVSFTSCCAGRNPTAHLGPYGVSLGPEQRGSAGPLGVSRSDLTHSSAISPLPTFTIPRQNVCPQHPNPTEPHYPRTARGAPCDSPPRALPFDAADRRLPAGGTAKDPLGSHGRPDPHPERPAAHGGGAAPHGPNPIPIPSPGDAAAARGRAPPPSRVPPLSRRPLSAHGGGRGDRGFARKCGSVAPPRVGTLPLPPAADPVSAGGVAGRGGAAPSRSGGRGGGSAPVPAAPIRARIPPAARIPNPGPAHRRGWAAEHAAFGSPRLRVGPALPVPVRRCAMRCGAGAVGWGHPAPPRSCGGSESAPPDAGLGGAA